MAARVPSVHRWHQDLPADPLRFRLIMYAHHDIAVPECLHGMAQNVPGHSLDDVLRKLGAAAGQS